MAITDAWPLQEAVYSAVSNAVFSEDILVVDHVLHDPPMEHVRIEGMEYADQSPKNAERGRHSFMISYYLRPGGEATTYVGLQRVWLILGMIHNAVKEVTVNNHKPRQRYMEATSDNDGHTQHGMIRYTIDL